MAIAATSWSAPTVTRRASGYCQASYASTRNCAPRRWTRAEKPKTTARSVLTNQTAPSGALGASSPHSRAAVSLGGSANGRPRKDDTPDIPAASAMAKTRIAGKICAKATSAVETMNSSSDTATRKEPVTIHQTAGFLSVNRPRPIREQSTCRVCAIPPRRSAGRRLPAGVILPALAGRQLAPDDMLYSEKESFELSSSATSQPLADADASGRSTSSAMPLRLHVRAAGRPTCAACVHRALVILREFRSRGELAG